MADFNGTMVKICSHVVSSAETSDQSWVGTALVVGAGGIGAAVAEELAATQEDGARSEAPPGDDDDKHGV